MKNVSVFILLASCVAFTACKNTKEQPEEQAVEVMPSWEVADDDVRCFPVDQDLFNHPIDELILPLSQTDSIWPRIQEGLYLEYVDNKSVNQQLNWYKSHPEYIKRVQMRAARYLYHIVNRLHEEQVPYDIALLPIVESAYEPFSYSHGQASGLWQFIPGTGKRFKLEQGWWYDGRRDAVASTDAAIAYLKYLHRYFDKDWQLAIAAYNSGEGTVRKAIRKNKAAGKGTDFWSLDLPRETRAYVPKMIALSELFRNPEKYDIELLHIDNQPFFTSISLESQLDLAQAAKLSGISIEELYYLNSGLNRWATPPNKNYDFKIPMTNVKEFQQALAELPKDQRVTWHRHTIKSGESLSVIAQKYNSEKGLICEVNNLTSSQIVAGKTLMIPMASASNSEYLYSETQRLSKRQNIKPKAGTRKVTYYVQSGDSFWKIAKDHNVEIQSLAKWNNNSPKDTLKLGQKLVIWTNSATPNINTRAMRSPKIRKINYQVRQGDSLAKVAGKFKLRIQEILSWNNINPEKYLQPGQGLTLYINVMDTY